MTSIKSALEIDIQNNPNKTWVNEVLVKLADSLVMFSEHESRTEPEDDSVTMMQATDHRHTLLLGKLQFTKERPDQFAKFPCV